MKVLSQSLHFLTNKDVWYKKVGRVFKVYKREHDKIDPINFLRRNISKIIPTSKIRTFHREVKIVDLMWDKNGYFDFKLDYWESKCMMIGWNNTWKLSIIIWI